MLKIIYRFYNLIKALILLRIKKKKKLKRFLEKVQKEPAADFPPVFQHID